MADPGDWYLWHSFHTRSYWENRPVDCNRRELLVLFFGRMEALRTTGDWFLGDWFLRPRIISTARLRGQRARLGARRRQRNFAGEDVPGSSYKNGRSR